MVDDTDHDRIRQIGDLAENYFEKLCIKSRYNKSRPGYDSMGWDYLVEIPEVALSTRSFDARQGASRALVQVKATDSFDGSLNSINVKNHEHLAKALLPSFVFIVDYKGTEEPVSAYLCHYDDIRIGATLKRLRELQAEGINDIHKRTMVMRPTEEERFDLTTPNALQSMLRSVIGTDYASYVRRKADIIETIGYEKGTHVARGSSFMDSSALSNALVGLGEIKIEGGTVSTTRFDIELEKRDFTSAVIRFEPVQAGPCQIIATTKRPRRKLSIVGQTLIPGVHNLSHGLFKLRVSSAFFDILLSDHTLDKETFDVNFTFDPHKVYSLNDLINGVELLTMCAAKDISLELVKDGKTFCTGGYFIGQDLHKDFYILQARLKTLLDFLHMVGYRDPVSLCANELFEQRESIAWMEVAIK